MTDKKNIPNGFTDAIEKTISQFGMLGQKDTVLAAVSGGPDSVALVLALLALKNTYHIEIGIAHVNHLLRGQNAQRDEDFSRTLAKHYDLNFHCEQTDVKAYALANGLSIEAAGREVRYRFFAKTSQTHGYTKIATGHHKDDSAEQVLMNLLRGSGPKGLCGIPPVREKNIIRPLIQASKNEIQQFLKTLNQEFMTDDSNSDPQYLRNKIRHRLIPLLQSEYNPEIIDALNRLSHIMVSEEDFWQQTTESAFNQCLIRKETRSIVLSKVRMADLEPALSRRVFRMAIEQVKTNLNRISHGHINSIINFCFNQTSGKSLDLPGRIRIYKTKDTLLIKKEDKPLREIGKFEKHLKRAAQNKQESK